MLVNELCHSPYHSSAIALFLSASHTNYHHFFIKTSSMLLPKDMENFANENPEITERLIRVYHLREPAPVPLLRRSISTEDEDAMPDWAT